MKPDICIYHGNCADGFGAAWAVWKRFGDAVEYFPGVYGQQPPDVAGKNVIIVDFSYRRPVLESLLQSGDVKQAMTVLILDHHKTAAEDLADIDRPTTGYDPDHWRAQWEQELRWPVRALFDMTRSGAGLAWDFFHVGVARPKLLNHVEDRDLWRFNLPLTREIQSCVFSHPYDFATWDRLVAECERDVRGMAAEGYAIDRKLQKDIAELLKVATRRMVIGGYDVPVVNLPYTMASEAAGKLAADHGEVFGASYFDGRDGRVFSLRSRGDFDVSAIAKMYGGGGHRNAAGFRRPIGWEGDNA